MIIFWQFKLIFGWFKLVQIFAKFLIKEGPNNFWSSWRRHCQDQLFPRIPWEVLLQKECEGSQVMLGIVILEIFLSGYVVDTLPYYWEIFCPPGRKRHSWGFAKIAHTFYCTILFYLFIFDSTKVFREFKIILK